MSFEGIFCYVYMLDVSPAAAEKTGYSSPGYLHSPVETTLPFPKDRLSPRVASEMRPGESFKSCLGDPNDVLLSRGTRGARGASESATGVMRNSSIEDDPLLSALPEQEESDEGSPVKHA